jgi:hypothetical protein
MVPILAERIGRGEVGKVLPQQDRGPVKNIVNELVRQQISGEARLLTDIQDNTRNLEIRWAENNFTISSSNQFRLSSNQLLNLKTLPLIIPETSLYLERVHKPVTNRFQVQIDVNLFPALATITPDNDNGQQIFLSLDGAKAKDIFISLEFTPEQRLTLAGLMASPSELTPLIPVHGLLISEVNKNNALLDPVLAFPDQSSTLSAVRLLDVIESSSIREKYSQINPVSILIDKK